MLTTRLVKKSHSLFARAFRAAVALLIDRIVGQSLSRECRLRSGGSISRYESVYVKCEIMHTESNRVLIVGLAGATWHVPDAWLSDGASPYCTYWKPRGPAQC